MIWLHDNPEWEPGGRTPIPPRSDELLCSNDGVGRSFFLPAALRDIVPQISALFSDAGATQTFPVRLFDVGSWLETGQLHAREVITGWGRVVGQPFAVVANNAIKRGGIIFPECCRKISRFVEFCGKCRLPIIILVDNPGLMVGVDSERGGMLVEASELLVTLFIGFLTFILIDLSFG